ncbi:gliding motility protein GldM [Prevotella sp. S7 MS 2]|uniref:type IX secretion system motor protein PorM/GldM n=1 Tax=Prevotella sp. S7 MS 2 TaxID=1287488 RepID=UPI0005131CDD|nr:gliding motility protein GldM [Prevotella sp. S7 MS 2]KGI60306.1 gliding motility-associated protein GldM [Prevotella sp. S7 MS 2]
MAIKKRPVSPRQKMINLMYVVLMALLALNVSTEVLNGFSIVEESLDRTTRNSTKENTALYEDFANQAKNNPEKLQAWFAKATQVREMSDSLYNFAQELKEAIVREADGKDADLRNIENKEDLEAASLVMLSPGTGRGKQLFNSINVYRGRILKLVSDSVQRQLIASNLSTALPRKAYAMGKNWQEYMFENMPVAAAVTLLSKLQNDVRYAEGEVLHTLISNVDLKDFRVNKLEAYVVPESKTVISGDMFSARIVMAAVDTLQQPEIYVGGQRISGNTYRFTAGGVGEHSFSGYIAMRNGRGDVIRRNFLQKYTVVGPSATVSADLMNVLYAGYDNPISISIPGVPLNAVSASMSGGGFRSIGMGRYIARPTTIGQKVTIQVSATQNGRSRQMGSFTFQVRKLPDPAAYLQIGSDRFRGGALSKAALIALDNVSAAIDDGILDVPFRVQSFETVFYDNMGNAVPMASEGASFSARQRDTFRKLSRNRRFYINRVTAVGPDGIVRRLPASMEIIVR